MTIYFKTKIKKENLGARLFSQEKLMRMLARLRNDVSSNGWHPCHVATVANESISLVPYEQKDNFLQQIIVVFLQSG